MKAIVLIINLAIMSISFAQNQDSLPFREISEVPSVYSSGAVVTRMIDGLGYRYYWASEGLTTNDLNYKPIEEARNTMETLQHIYDLSVTIKNVALKIPNIRPYEKKNMTYEKLRVETLLNLETARNLFLKTDNLEEHLVSFQKEGKTNDFPFWNFLNGPLADAIYHTGQVVVFRRASGNPMDSKVRVFTGKNTEH